MGGDTVLLNVGSQSLPAVSAEKESLVSLECSLSVHQSVPLKQGWRHLKMMGTSHLASIQQEGVELFREVEVALDLYSVHMGEGNAHPDAGDQPSGVGV